MRFAKEKVILIKGKKVKHYGGNVKHHQGKFNKLY